MPKPKRPPKRINGKWWAVVDTLDRRPVPCLFHSREAARGNAEPSERVIRVAVQETK